MKRSLVVAAVTVGLTALLAACGPSSSSYASQACHDVLSGLRALHEYQTASSPSAAQAALARSVHDLRNALPLAALAAGTNGEYQALQATLSESNRVPVSHLQSALSAQCKAILSGGAPSIPASSTTAP
ncbi:MAG: hypothetical protein ACP5PJ_07980 [Acidimicrobiales bacterium]